MDLLTTSAEEMAERIYRLEQGMNGRYRPWAQAPDDDRTRINDIVSKGLADGIRFLEHVAIAEQDLEIAAYRCAGQTERAHTLPHHGSYSVAQHSAQALSLLFLLYPGEPSVSLIKAVLWHDLPERELGDIPAQAKWYNSGLHEAYRQAESNVFAMRYPRAHFALNNLTPDEREWLRGVDYLELMLWCGDQVGLGNANASIVVERILHRIQDDKLPQPIMNYIERCLQRQGNQ
jgi:5'-deoxynucleotidase YfbR-like HD superfamily hydrolase